MSVNFSNCGCEEQARESQAQVPAHTILKQVFWSRVASLRTVKVGSVLLHVTILIVIVSIKSINVASSVNDQDQDQSSG